MPTHFLRTEDPNCNTPRHTYERSRDLPRLLPLWPNEQAALASNCAIVRQSVVARLQTALRAERRRGQSGHWSYDLNRHSALRQAYIAEATAHPRREDAVITRDTPAHGSHACQLPTLQPLSGELTNHLDARP